MRSVENVCPADINGITGYVIAVFPQDFAMKYATRQACCRNDVKRW